MVIVANHIGMVTVIVIMLMTIQPVIMTMEIVAKETLQPLGMVFAKMKTTMPDAALMMEIVA